MRIFRFDAATGHPITAFGSANVAISPILRGADPIQIACMRIGPGGVIGAHPAVGPQLFLVVQGEGWVRGASGASSGLSCRTVCAGLGGVVARQVRREPPWGPCTQKVHVISRASALEHAARKIPHLEDVREG